MSASPVAVRGRADWRNTEKKVCPQCKEVFWPSERMSRTIWDRQITCSALCSNRMPKKGGAK